MYTIIMTDKDFKAGLFGGVAGVALSHPIDTIKTRIQLGNFKMNGLYSGVAWPLVGLYNGVAWPLVGVGLEKLLVFGNYEKFKNYGVFENEGLNIIGAGLMSGLICTSIVTPLERIKINLQNMENPDARRVVRDMMNIREMYRGWSSTLIREVPGYAIYFGLYELMKMNTNEFKWYYSFAYGGLSGAGAWSVIYPSDVIKTRMQLRDNRYGLIRTTKNIYHEGGIPIFYRGFTLAVMRAFVLHSGVFAGYELYMKYC